MKRRPVPRNGVRPRARRWLWLFALCALAVVSASLLAPRPPAALLPAAPTRYLDDRAKLLAPEFAAAKDQYLQHLSRTMRIAQINVVILPGAPPAALEEFTVEAATVWRLGTGGVDNGLLLFIFPERRVARLEVGYGLEAVITDAAARRLLAQTLEPAFAHGRYEQGLDDFLSALNQALEASEAAGRRAAPRAALLPFVWNVLRSSPVLAQRIWRVFLAQDAQGRIVLALFGAVFASLLGSALLGVAAGIPALLMLPFRLLASRSLRHIDKATLAEQFAPLNFLARPPPFFVGLFDELQLGAILNALLMAAGIVVGIALLFAESSIFVGGLGRFGGAGATLAWPAL